MASLSEHATWSTNNIVQVPGMTWPSGEAPRALRTYCVYCTSSVFFFFFSRGKTPNNLYVFLSLESRCPIWNLAYSAVEPSV